MRTIIAILAIFALASLVETHILSGILTKVFNAAPSYENAPSMYEANCSKFETVNIKLSYRRCCDYASRTLETKDKKEVCKRAKMGLKKCPDYGDSPDYSKKYFRCCNNKKYLSGVTITSGPH
jgi:hypothetical protein